MKIHSLSIDAKLTLVCYVAGNIPFTERDEERDTYLYKLVNPMNGELMILGDIRDGIDNALNVALTEFKKSTNLKMYEQCL